MDYKEKYNAARERARELSKTVTGANYEYIFPELKEDDGERIRKGLINGFKECLEDCQYPKNAVKYWHNVEVDNILAWLEKQGKQKSSLPKWKYKKGNTPLLRDSLVLNKYGCVLKALSGAIISDAWVLDYAELAELPREEPEKCVEQKPADKTTPKFNVGDWVLNNVCFPMQIVSIKNGMYIFTEGDAISISFVDENYHLWTITDAKDGDVLYLQHKGAEHVIIYKRLVKKNFHTILSVHCAYNGSTNDFFEDCDSYHCITSERDEKEIRPATKEQCNTLFVKMKEAGYEWDNDKKKLNKK